MIQRQLAPCLKQSAAKFPIIGVVGPRQSGKTTLVQAEFPDYQYLSLEDLDNREFATQDPRGFLAAYPEKMILDEIQKVPALFSYLQTHVDASNQPGQYILTGSQHFLMMESISQSLAGRIALHTLLPLSLTELADSIDDYPNYLFQGSYPRVYDQAIAPTAFYPNYLQTYVERDVRSLRQITDLAAFQTFLKLCAGRIGQLVNLSSLANDAGITHNTAKSWLSLLEASFIVFLQRPHHRNFRKRLVKSPKLYFVDTGLAASLLGIESAGQLATHHLVGNLFENMVVSEYLKHQYNQARSNQGYFWRDQSGLEVDLLIEAADRLVAVEIKAGRTINSSYFTNLSRWRELAGARSADSYVVYGGDELQKRQAGTVVGWKQLNEIFDSAR